MNSIIPIAAVVALSATAAAQTYEVSLVAPDIVQPGDTWTVEVWASWSGIDEHPDNGAALAGFAVSALGSGGTSVSTATLNPSLLTGSSTGNVDGGDLLEVFGGQLANIGGFANPDVNTDNPIILFSFEVTADTGFFGDVSYTATPGLPSFRVTMAVYPDANSGSSINTNNPDAELILGSVTTTVIPAPAGTALLGLVAIVAARRRR